MKSNKRNTDNSNVIDLVDSFLASQLDAINKFKIGVTKRSDLLEQKIYIENGNSEFNSKQQFASVVCPFVKVDIEFNLSDKKEKQKTDTIKNISKPYLEITKQDRCPFVCSHADFELVRYLGECLSVLDRMPPNATRENILEYFKISSGMNSRKVTKLMFKKNNNININVTFHWKD
ncbi:MAG: hypothetical protein LBE18_08875 [Planctomycetaceae bacterium]|nr:hypothetical protein [Planctomycetaceae bacterium]